MIQYARSEDSGDYTCEFGGDRSDPLALRVSDGHVLLQTSPSVVYEGDMVTLTCHHRGGNATNSTFYKGGEVLESRFVDYLYLVNMDKADADTYMCRKVITHEQSGDFTDDDSADITVRELFSDPGIKVSPHPVTEGAAVTLTCDTRLALPRAKTELWYAFYRNGQKVQEFGKSNQYWVNLDQQRDSGNYTCEVRTDGDGVKKTSQGINIQTGGAAVKPVVFFLSKWGKIFSEEPITLTCNADFMYKGSRKYSWYKNHKAMNIKDESFKIPSARPEDSGDYTCGISGGDQSDPLTLRVNGGHVILQTSPSHVYEGDKLTLWCHHRKGSSANGTMFYKGSEILESHERDYVYLIDVDKAATGTYTCAKVITLTNEGNVTDEDSADISIKELFSDPEINVSLYPLTEGATVTLMCDTLLAPPRAQTALWHAFYRNGKKVQEFGITNLYGIPFFRLQDGGNYTCEVKTATDSVKKSSRGINIQIGGTKSNEESQISYTRQNILRLVLSTCVLIVVLFVVYHEMNTLAIKPASSESVTSPSAGSAGN
uniref:Ig-like domain-containing protein n=1 Tax=Leptobrachium leishanense TaxID=445787 RepID=A0A8C5N2D0_9ANUR